MAHRLPLYPSVPTADMTNQSQQSTPSHWIQFSSHTCSERRSRQPYRPPRWEPAEFRGLDGLEALFYFLLSMKPWFWEELILAGRRSTKLWNSRKFLPTVRAAQPLDPPEEGPRQLYLGDRPRSSAQPSFSISCFKFPFLWFRVGEGCSLFNHGIQIIFLLENFLIPMAILLGSRSSKTLQGVVQLHFLNPQSPLHIHSHPRAQTRILADFKHSLPSPTDTLPLYTFVSSFGWYQLNWILGHGMGFSSLAGLLICVKTGLFSFISLCMSFKLFFFFCLSFSVFAIIIRVFYEVLIFECPWIVWMLHFLKTGFDNHQILLT